jgi:hypothetical protein
MPCTQGNGSLLGVGLLGFTVHRDVNLLRVASSRVGKRKSKYGDLLGERLAAALTLFLDEVGTSIVGARREVRVLLRNILAVERLDRPVARTKTRSSVRLSARNAGHCHERTVRQ